jgi:hypothetical protein
MAEHPDDAELAAIRARRIRQCLLILVGLLVICLGIARYAHVRPTDYLYPYPT